MHRIEEMFREFCRERMKPLRRGALGLTQEKTAEKMRMSTRGYQKLERGVHGPQGATLALFLAQLPDDEMTAFVRDFAQRVQDTHGKEVA